MASNNSVRNRHAHDAAVNASGGYVARAFGELLRPADKLSPLFRAIHPANIDNDRKRVAAAQISHLVSGWGYASSAISSYLKNAKDEAVHYAYYAELRAALSLYAGSGAHFKEGNNFYILSNGRKKELSNDFKLLKTHTIAWDFWNEWLKRSDAQDLILDGFRLAPSVSLRDLQPVLSLFDASGAVKDWGKDLMQAPYRDRKARNKASYEPDLVQRRLSPLTADDLNFIAALCRLLLPAENGLQDSALFDMSFIQYHLIKTIEDKARVLDENGEGQLEESRLQLIKGICEVTGQSASILEHLVPAELDQNIIGVFEKAAGTNALADNVLSRAIFLLRLSTISVKKNIASSGSDVVKEWLLNWLDVSGFIEKDSGIEPFDLFSDFELALDLFLSKIVPEFRLDAWDADSLSSSKIARVDSSLAWSVFS